MSMLDFYKEYRYKDIHKTIFKGETLYFVHAYYMNYDSKYIDSGKIFLVYKAPNLQKFHDCSAPVLSYKIGVTIENADYIELSNMILEEDYRRLGIGSLLLKYFETKIVRRHFDNIEIIKGVLLIGEEAKLHEFYKKNGYVIYDGVIIKRL